MSMLRFEENRSKYRETQTLNYWILKFFGVDKAEIICKLAFTLCLQAAVYYHLLRQCSQLPSGTSVNKQYRFHCTLSDGQIQTPAG